LSSRLKSHIRIIQRLKRKQKEMIRFGEKMVCSQVSREAIELGRISSTLSIAVFVVREKL
jgi:hypothetical protein